MTTRNLTLFKKFFYLQSESDTDHFSCGFLNGANNYYLVATLSSIANPVDGVGDFHAVDSYLAFFNKGQVLSRVYE